MTAPRAIHLDAGGRPRCGHPHAACLTGDEGNVTCGGCLSCMRADSAPATVHLAAGGRPRCGHPGARSLTDSEAAVTCGGCLARMRGGNNLGLRHPDWQLRPHGTAAAARRHYRRGERLCESCRQYEIRRHAGRREQLRRAA